jgi:hypothetical protein
MTNGYIYEETPLATVKASRAASPHKLYPTPTTSDGSGGPGTTPKRAGGKNLRTVVNEIEGNGRLNPVWVEWMMGLPAGWTDASVPYADLVAHNDWQHEPLPRTVADRSVPDRTKRIRALGNGLVPQAARFALANLYEGAIHARP